MQTPKLLKVKDVAAILGISHSSAYRLMQTRIPCIRFGRTVRVRIEDLMHFLEVSLTIGSFSEGLPPQGDGGFTPSDQEKQQAVWSKRQ